MTRFSLLLLALCFAALAAEQSSHVPTDAPAWVTQLTAPGRPERQAAMENLRKAGESVRPLLEEAAKSSEKDRAVSARWLLAILKIAPTLDKAKAAMTATKPVTATIAMGSGADAVSLDFQTMGDGKRMRFKLPWASVVADGKFVWIASTLPGAFDEPNAKPQTLVTKRTIEDLNAESPGALNKLPGSIYLDAICAAFDFTTVKDGTEDAAEMLFVDGWLKRPELLSQAAIMKAVRAGDPNAQQLLFFSSLPGLARMRIVLEKKSYLLRRVDMQDRDGKLLNTGRFDYDFTAIPEDTFTFVPPKDATVMEMTGAMLKGLRDEVKSFTDKQREKSAAKEKQ